MNECVTPDEIKSLQIEITEAMLKILRRECGPAPSKRECTLLMLTLVSLLANVCASISEDPGSFDRLLDAVQDDLRNAAIKAFDIAQDVRNDKSYTIFTPSQPIN